MLFNFMHHGIRTSIRCYVACSEGGTSDESLIQKRGSVTSPDSKGGSVMFMVRRGPPVSGLNQ